MDDLPITLNLTVIKVNTLLHYLGKLPTETNVWPLAMEIKEQADAQVPAPPPAE